MDWPKGSHGNTYGGNPLACAAALATIEAIEKGYMENAASDRRLYASKTQRNADRHPSIGEVRGLGLMIGMEFVEDRKSKKYDPIHCATGWWIYAYEKGLLTLGCGKSVIRISPPSAPQNNR